MNRPAYVQRLVRSRDNCAAAVTRTSTAQFGLGGNVRASVVAKTPQACALRAVFGAGASCVRPVPVAMLCPRHSPRHPCEWARR